MGIIDFIYYYLATFFTNRKDSLIWSTPESRAVYALSLIITSWIMAAFFFFLIYILKIPKFNSDWILILIPVALFFMWFFKRVYINNQRYNLLKLSSNGLFRMDESLGIFLAWLILSSSFAMPFIILVSNMK